MKPRIHVITLGVEDLQRSLAFYRDGLGFASGRILGEKLLDPESNAAGAVAMFQLESGLAMCLYPLSELAKDANVARARVTPGTFSIGHAVATRDEVDAVIAAARAAGGTVTDPPRDRPWAYSGYFRDPDGHLWEVIHNPSLKDI